MNKKAIDLVLDAVRNDPKFSMSQKSAIVKAFVQPGGHIALIDAKRAATIMQVSTKTIHNYAKQGLLHPIRWSKRNIKFKAAEVINLATHGINPE